MSCVVCKLPEDAELGAAERFCDKHWHATPLASRRRYWRETDHGAKPPDELLLVAIIARVRYGIDWHHLNWDGSDYHVLDVIRDELRERRQPLSPTFVRSLAPVPT
jgi:hypothetical protein